jgi:hypothetical protein
MQVAAASDINGLFIRRMYGKPQVMSTKSVVLRVIPVFAVAVLRLSGCMTCHCRHRLLSFRQTHALHQ